MKIISVEAFIIKIEREQSHTLKTRALTDDYYLLDQPLSVIYSKKNETVLVRITTDEGIAGWGEALAPTNPDVVFSLIRSSLAPAVLGVDPLENEVIQRRLYNMYRVRGYDSGFLEDAMAAVDIALWDIKGKAFRQPCWKLMGGSDKETVPVYLSSNKGRTPEEREEDIRRCLASGIRAYKLHALDGGWRVAAQVIETIRKECSADSLDLMHDGHWNYSFREALALGRVLDDADAVFFECPLPPENSRNYSDLAARLRTPVAAGESLRGIHRFKTWIDQGAVRFLQPDVGRIGITDYLKTALLAEQAGLETGPHLSVHQAPGIMASIHLSFAVCSTAFFEYQPPSIAVAKQYSDFDFYLSGGALKKPLQNGLGIDISEKALQAYVTNHSRIS